LIARSTANIFPYRLVWWRTLRCRATAKRYGFMHATDIQKAILVQFWKEFGGKKSKGFGFSDQEKIAELIRLSKVVIPFKRQQPLDKRRASFQAAKSKLHSWKRYWNCFVCLRNATARHHIIQLQNGGLNSKKNLVSLCDACHSKVHPWMSEYNQGTVKARV
jgi:hypothetical protein